MKHALVLVLLCCAQLAHAGTVLVLRSEGTADTASRTSVDTHVLRLAKSLDGKVEAGDITLTEAAALVGCNPSDAACKDDVLVTMGVDEVVATTVTATPSGMNVTVRRITKGNAKAAQTTIPSGKNPDAKLNADIGPLFGLAAAPLVEKSVEPEAKPEPKASTQPSAQPVKVADTSKEPIDPTVSAAPNGAVTRTPAEGRSSNRLPKIGMGVGAGFLVLGFIMWSQASDVQNQIDGSPEPRSPADFKRLQDLEAEGDSYAGAGNLFFLTGVAVGGISTYFYLRNRKASTQTARIAPAVYPGGAGVTLTFGGR